MKQGFAIGDRILGLSGDTHPDWSVAHAVLRSYQIIGASAVGKLHLAKGTPRDDAFAIRSYGPWLAVGVSDGVGSRPLSRYGATYVAEALASLLLRSFVPSLQEELKANEEASPSSKTSNLPLLYHESNLDIPNTQITQDEAKKSLESTESKDSDKKYRDESIKEHWEDALNLLSKKMRECGSQPHSNSTDLQQAASVGLWSNNNPVVDQENEPSNEGDINDLDEQKNTLNEDNRNDLDEQKNTSNENNSNDLDEENKPVNEGDINALADQNEPVKEDDGNAVDDKDNSSNEAENKALDAQEEPLNEDESNASNNTRGQSEKNLEEQKDNCEPKNYSDLEEKMRQAFKEVHQNLSGQANYLRVELKDLSCTALGLLLNVETGEVAVGQVGDGVILGLTAHNKEIEHLVEAENTGDSQSTYTINRSDFEKHLKVGSTSLSDKGFQSLFVMTDGVSEDVIYSEPSALNKWGQGIDNNLRNSANLAESSAGMLNWLATYHIPGSWDDRTLIVITKN